MNTLQINVMDGPTLRDGYLARVPKTGTFTSWSVPHWESFLDTPNEKIIAPGTDFLVLFPSCAAFSLMSVNVHWKKTPLGYDLISDKARLTVQVLNKMAQLIEMVPFWMIENPRSIMRSFWDAGTMHYITHCPYGGTRMKPTNIWTNVPWTPLPPCKPTDLCHKEGSIRTIDGVDIEVVRTRRRKTRLQQTVLPLQLQKDLLEAAQKALE